MQCQLISPNHNVIEINYYELEKTCRRLVREYLNDKNKKERLFRKKAFFDFRLQYQTFSPYFDFVILHMGYTLTNPFFISKSILSIKHNEGINYFYANYQENDISAKDKAHLQPPIFMQGKEENINRIQLTEETGKIKEGFINEKLELLSLKGNCELHNFWAVLWLHELLKSQRDVCENYLERKEKDLLLYDKTGMLLDYYPWFRFCLVEENPIYNGKYLVYFNSKNNSELQNKLLINLQKKKLLSKELTIDINEE